MSKRALKIIIEILKIDLKRDNCKLNKEVLNQDLEYFNNKLNEA